MDAESPRRSHAAQNAVDPRTLTRDELRDYLLSVPTVSVEFAGACMGVSRPAAYRAAAAGDIRCLRVGRRRVVPSVWLQRVLMLDETAPPAVSETAVKTCLGSDSGTCPHDAHALPAESEGE